VARSATGNSAIYSDTVTGKPAIWISRPVYQQHELSRMT
jgi:hypothetical protein